MKKIRFEITLANYKDAVVDLLDGRTRFPWVGYVYSHPKHEGRKMAVCRTGLIAGRYEGGIHPHPTSWWVFDVESGFRMPHIAGGGQIAYSRAAAIELADQVLDRITPEKVDAVLAKRRAKLAEFWLGKDIA